MLKKLLLVGIMVICMCGSAVLALDPMGPPAAGLAQKQWSAGIEYSYTDMDMKAINGKTTLMSPFETESFGISNVKIDKIYGRIGYGISDKWEAFLRLGAADAEGDADWPEHYSTEGSVDSDRGFAFGFGTKATFFEQSPKLKWGGLAQMSWRKNDGKLTIEEGVYSGLEADTQIEVLEVQLALGPTWQAADYISVYGGPFLHFVDGELKGKAYGEEGEYDLEQDSVFGGYIGTQIGVTNSCDLNLEAMFTGDATAWAVSLIFAL